MAYSSNTSNPNPNRGAVEEKTGRKPTRSLTLTLTPGPPIPRIHHDRKFDPQQKQSSTRTPECSQLTSNSYPDTQRQSKLIKHLQSSLIKGIESSPSHNGISLDTSVLKIDIGRESKLLQRKESSVRTLESSQSQTKFRIPWAPSDSKVDHERQSKLLERMKFSIRTLEGSQFYSRFLSQLREPQVKDGLTKIRSCGSPIQMVVYGIGRLESEERSRLQLSLALLLQQELGVGSKMEVFDPVLSTVECEVVKSLGCSVITFNEECRREVAGPTLFYMPHCHVRLYDNLLVSNKSPSMLNRMAILGNGFGKYQQNCSMFPGFARDALHILGLMNYVREVGINESIKACHNPSCDEVDCFCEAFLIRAGISSNWTTILKIASREFSCPG